MAPGERFSFTRPRLNALPTPDSETWVWDSKIRGLACRLTASGTRSLYFFRRWGSQLVKVKLDDVDAMPIDAARKQVEFYNSEIAAGRDPRAGKRKAKREEPTFALLYASWLAKHGRRLRGRKEWERIYAVYLERKWAGRRLDSIQKPEVAAWHLRLGEDRGEVQGNRALSLFKMIFSATEGIGWSGESPAKGVKKFPETPRDRYLQAEELPRFFAALAEEPNPFLQGFFILCLATAARRGTIQRMKWSELDLSCPSGPYWRCPQTKSGKVQVISLIPLAVSVLSKLRPLSGGSEYVFPAQRQGKRGDGFLKDPMPAWRRLCSRAGLSDVRIHDLRRSAASWAAVSGISLPTIAAALGHSAGSAQTEIYARLSQDSQRAALTAAADAMARLGGPAGLLGYQPE